MHQNLNWAEELHQVIGAFIIDLAKRKAQAERLLELRAKKLKIT